MMYGWKNALAISDAGHALSLCNCYSYVIWPTFLVWSWYKRLVNRIREQLSGLRSLRICLSICSCDTVLLELLVVLLAALVHLWDCGVPLFYRRVSAMTDLCRFVVCCGSCGCLSSFCIIAFFASQCSFLSLVMNFDMFKCRVAIRRVRFCDSIFAIDLFIGYTSLTHASFPIRPAALLMLSVCDYECFEL